jgi:chorismate synthase
MTIGRLTPALNYGRETEISTIGRHDPCVGIRAVPIGEAMAGRDRSKIPKRRQEPVANG